tara:strand:+ start:879 stop:1061 length:183 start_codon:yes stop_codon:yes gene_type:complete
MEWISVSDELPDHGLRVLIIEMPEGNIDIGEILAGGFVESEEYKERRYTTHWQLLPEPPK